MKAGSRKGSGTRGVASSPKGLEGGKRKDSDWRVRMLEEARRLIKEADPGATEERKWRKPSNPDGVPVWYHDGIICTGETYKEHVKLTFARGALLKDPSGLFNGTMGGNTVRAIDIREGDRIEGSAFKELVRAAVAFNTSGKK